MGSSPDCMPHGRPTGKPGISTIGAAVLLDHLVVNDSHLISSPPPPCLTPAMPTPAPLTARAQRARTPIAVRLDVVCRVLVAVPGNHAATALCVVAIARLLPGGALSAAVTATLLSFALFAAGVVATFAARDGLRAGLWLAGIAAVAGTVVALTGAPA